MNERLIPVMQPLLPRAEQLLPYLKQIDENRWYSNHGPMLTQLRDRLAEHFAVPAPGVTLVANGTVALTIALQALGVMPGARCLLPAWTFIGTVAAVCAAGLKPHFVDVDEQTWTLDLDAIRRRGDLADVGVVILVSAFGAPVDRSACDRFTDELGIPVLIDAAAGFDSAAIAERSRPGRTPIMISLHATKAFGIGEGGLLLSTDLEFSDRAEKLANFGFSADPDVSIIGVNAKLSEYHAAVGLAALDEWSARRERLRLITERYLALLPADGGLALSPFYGDGWVSTYCCVLIQDAARVVERLDHLGIQTRRWWRQGCHRFQAYANLPADPLPVSERLAAEMVGLPFFVDMSEADQARVATALPGSR